MLGAPIFVAILVMAALAVIEASVLPRFPIVGIVPQLPFLVALVWGHLRGLEEGLIWAFIAGLFVDLFSLAPLGLSSLAFMVGVGLPILLGRVLPPRHLLIVILQAALGTLIYLAVYAVALRVFGHGVSSGGLLDLLPLIGLHAVLVVPIYLLLSTILRAVKPRRVEF